MAVHDNTKGLPFLPPVLNKFDPDRLVKEAARLGSSYFIAMPKHDGGMVIFLPERLLLPGRGNKPPEYSTVCTRQGMLIPNKTLRTYLEEINSKFNLSHMVGEIHSVDENLSKATSTIADESLDEIDPSIRLTIFNYEGPGPFYHRMEYVRQAVEDITDPEYKHFIKAVQMISLSHPDGAFTTYEGLLTSGAFNKLEGLVLTHENAPYVGGVRGKTNPHAMKYVQLESGEFEVIDLIERKYGKNLKTVPPELWNTPKGDLGALVCKLNQLTFQVGTGFTDQQRKDFWERKSSIIGKYAFVEYQDLGSKGKPTKPRFRALRTGPSGDYLV